MRSNESFPPPAGLELAPNSRAWAEVDIAAIRANSATIVRLASSWSASVVAVVKADAYGHGLLPASGAALEGGAVWLGVATAAEGLALRSSGIRAPVLLLCAPAPCEAEAALRAGLTPVVGEVSTVATLTRAAATAGLASPAVHLEIDTGIGRAGVLPEQAVTLWRHTVESGLRVAGLMTHYADADGDGAFTGEQSRSFERVKKALESAGARFEETHLMNSAAALRSPCPANTLVRAGLLLYGIQPASGDARLALRPAMTVKARVAMVRDLPAGHPISYGMTCRLTRPGRVATVLIGYGDGYPRRLSNCGAMLLHGRRAPILGRVCMDQTVVDVTDIGGVEPGDVAVCLGGQGNERISVEELAALVQTTEHEITTCLTARLPRIIIDG